MWQLFRKPLLTLCALSAISQSTMITSAIACGGFFCNINQPVNQNAERIVFAHDQGKIHMHVQINYQGPPTNFGWILPVPADVTTDLSSEAFFSALDRLYGPFFNLDLQSEEGCQVFISTGDNFRGSDAGIAQSTNDNQVQVLSREEVGPYDRVILQATSVDALRAWLNDNEFAIPEAIDEKLAPYIELGSAFVLIKLLSNQDSGDIVPLYLTYRGSRPSIPLKPTGVAASNDMGVIVNIFDQHRAVPINYRHVIINEALIDWANRGDNYADVVSQAIDEAGGKAFVTDYAGRIDSQLSDLFQPYPEAYIAEVSAAASIADLYDAQYRYISDPTNPDYQRIFRSILIRPEGIPDEDYQACPDCYVQPDQPVDGMAFAKKIRTEINPIYEHIQYLSQNLNYLTRLYSTLSPQEMEDDPTFSVNQDLGDVSNIHNATGMMYCDAEGQELSTDITLSNGQTFSRVLIEPTQRQDGMTVRGTNVPAALVIEQLMEAGQPELIISNQEIALPEDMSFDLSVLGNDVRDDGCQQSASFFSQLLILLSVFFMGRLLRKNLRSKI
jgi:hypothetical protein